MSVKGVCEMNKLAEIKKIADENNGIITTSDVTSRGISKTTLSTFVKQNDYERIYQGVYCSKDVWQDDLYLFSLRCPKTIFSHETALFLLDMTDSEPLNYTVTVKTGYNATHLRNDNIKVFSIKKEFFKLGIITVDTPYGNKILTYNAERTICDILRNRSKIEIGVFSDALKQYVKRKDKNLHRLVEYSKKLRVNNLLNKYLEVLL